MLNLLSFETEKLTKLSYLKSRVNCLKPKITHNKQQKRLIACEELLLFIWKFLQPTDSRENGFFKRRRQKQLDIRPQCLFSSVVSTYRYNTVSFCKTKKKLPLQSSMLTERQSSRLHPSSVYTPDTCSPWASTFPNGRHFEGLKHLWIYIYIYIFIFIFLY